MKKLTPFVVSQFTNPSGEIVYRLYARINGQRIRKNFATLAEARAEREILEVNYGSRSGFDWDALLGNAADLLSPSQVATLRRLHAASQANLP